MKNTRGTSQVSSTLPRRWYKNKDIIIHNQTYVKAHTMVLKLEREEQQRSEMI